MVPQIAHSYRCGQVMPGWETLQYDIHDVCLDMYLEHKRLLECVVNHTLCQNQTSLAGGDI